LLDAQVDWTVVHRSKLSGQELLHVLRSDLAGGRRIQDVSNTADYGQLRGQLLQFCLAEFADVDDVANALIELCPGVPTGEHSWAWKLRRDLALRILVRGSLFFWVS
jgi:hypothetical protein